MSSLHHETGISRDSPKPGCTRNSGNRVQSYLSCQGTSILNLKCEFVPQTKLDKGAKGPQQHKRDFSIQLLVFPRLPLGAACLLAQLFTLTSQNYWGLFFPQTWLNQCPSLSAHLQIILEVEATGQPQQSSELPEAVWTWAVAEGSR